MRYEPIVQGKARMRKAPSSKIQRIVAGKCVIVYKPNAKNSFNFVWDRSLERPMGECCIYNFYICYFQLI